MGHENRCAHIHGHNYVALVEAEADALDDIGRVIDFSVIKDVVGGWIDANWDHGMIVAADDGPLLRLMRSGDGGPADAPQKLYVMPTNPTAENMAAHLLREANRLLVDDGVRVMRVTIWETENCYATVEDV